MKKNKKILSNKINRLFYILMIIVIFSNIVFIPNISSAASVKQEVKSGISSFPSDYQALLNKLVNETGHTNWKFYAYYTGIDWNDLVKAEGKCGLNRIHKSYDTALRCSCNNKSSDYYCANDNATAYYMDPRNFINERNMFQFLDIAYNPEIQTKAKVEAMVKKYKVFNYGKSIKFIMSDENHKDYNRTVTMTYTDIIMEAAKQSNMSPINIVAKIVQEVGSNGSGSTSGTNSTYPNCYNYFNIGAYDTGDAVLNGLKYADSHGWHCPYTSIVEGAIFCGRDYINRGQNTSYFFKFDVVGTSILEPGKSQTINTNDFYYPQYMTNIMDPYSQSATLFSAYTNTDSLDEELVFIIPVYNNMPTEVQKPSSLDGKGYDLYFANVSSSVNARSGASTSSSLITYLYRGDKVAMLKKNYKSGWDQVKLWNGKTAYISNEYLLPVNSKVNGITLNKNRTSLYIGGVDSEQLIATVTPDYANNKAVTWTSSNNNIVTVTSSGLITARAEGTATITAKTVDQGKTATCLVTVTDISDNISKEILKVNESSKTVTILPEKSVQDALEVLGSDYKIYNKSNNQVTTGNMQTGFKVKKGNTEYEVVIPGDVNGDGKVSITDLAGIRLQLVGTNDYKGAYLKASMLSSYLNEKEATTTTISDLAAMRLYLVGELEINIK